MSVPENIREATCEDRIAGHLASRLQHVGDLIAVADDYDGDEAPATLARLQADGEVGEDLAPGEDAAEAARERLGELPLGVSRRTVFRIDLSTGGPADWLEVFCDGDTPGYEAIEETGEHFEPVRIVYHFADWFDHAERTLEGDEYETAERFARTVVAELMA